MDLRVVAAAFPHHGHLELVASCPHQGRDGTDMASLHCHSFTRATACREQPWQARADSHTAHSPPAIGGNSQLPVNWPLGAQCIACGGCRARHRSCPIAAIARARTARTASEENRVRPTVRQRVRCVKVRECGGEVLGCVPEQGLSPVRRRQVHLGGCAAQPRAVERWTRCCASQQQRQPHEARHDHDLV